MARVYLATFWLIALSAAAPLPLMILHPMLRPNFVGYSLALLAMLATSIKFALSELLSSEGFNMEKTACDMALALFTALLSLAVAQQFQDGIILPVTSIVGTRAPAAALAEARSVMWTAAGIVGAFFILSVALAYVARTLRGIEGRFQLLVRATCRILAGFSASICYVIYFVIVLLKGDEWT